MNSESNTGSGTESALYVHIPFCRHKCIYCDFYSVASLKDKDSYLIALKKEIAHYSGLYSAGRRFTSIFFGGGTPSIMEPAYIQEIISCLKDSFDVETDTEITMETNPGTVDSRKLSEFRNAGVNRLSIGIQSFNDEELKFLTRIHDSKTAVDTVVSAAAEGFDNLSIDLIFNLPGQTRQMWLSNLEKAVSLPVKHISAYSLILEPGTILNKMVLENKTSVMEEDFSAELYLAAIEYLDNCFFKQYEVSNFSKEGYQCRHNNAYWQYRDYISFGPSAHSFAGGRRWWNCADLKKYMDNVHSFGTSVEDSELLTKEQMIDEFVMLALRSSGLDTKKMETLLGTQWLNDKMPVLERFSGQGLLTIDEKFIKLTRQGYALCDEVLRLL